tara:strand:+ start:2104 stop:3123 length:1020 start_codon:yes stop_codon:yes gene_type:complete
MDLKTAFALAKKHAGRTDGLQLATIGADFVASRNDITGVRVAVETGLTGEPVRVDAVAACKMIAKAGKDVVLTGGRQLTITGTLGKFSLRATRKNDWAVPKLPSRWRPVTEAAAQALRAVAELASPTKDDPLSTVRLSPYMSCSRTFSSLAVCYVQPTIDAVTVPRTFLLKVAACRVGVLNNRLFLQTDKVVEWTRTLDAAYPDLSVYEAITNRRDRAGETFTVDIKALIPLVERAVLACRVPADAGHLTLTAGQLAVSLSSDLGGYQGAVAVEGGTTEPKTLGIRPPQLLRFLKAIKALQGDDHTRMHIAGDRDSLYLCTDTSTPVEALIQPVFVPKT